MNSEPKVPSRNESTAWFGTVVGLSGWTMFFASLVFAVGWFRMREPWPPLPTPTVLLALPGLPLLMGCVLLHRASRVESPRMALRMLTITVVLGGVYAGLQAAWTHFAWWDHHFRIPEDGLAASAFYGLTGLHVLHVLAASAGVFFCAVRLWRGAEVRFAVRRLALAWYFVTLMWGLVFVAVYLP